MDIGMAIIAAYPDIFKAPFFRFFMAGIAGNSQVSALQRKIACIMLFNSVGK